MANLTSTHFAALLTVLAVAGTSIAAGEDPVADIGFRGGYDLDAGTPLFGAEFRLVYEDLHLLVAPAVEWHFGSAGTGFLNIPFDVKRRFVWETHPVTPYLGVGVNLTFPGDHPGFENLAGRTWGGNVLGGMEAEIGDYLSLFTDVRFTLDFSAFHRLALYGGIRYHHH